MRKIERSFLEVDFYYENGYYEYEENCCMISEISERTILVLEKEKEPDSF